MWQKNCRVKQEIKPIEQPEQEKKISPRVTRGTNKDQDEAEDGFYDDFPVEIIKKFNLKISNKRKGEIYKSRRFCRNKEDKQTNPEEDKHGKKKELSSSIDKSKSQNEKSLS